MISHNSAYEPPVKFRVQVGLTAVTVEGCSRGEIIEQARQKLCHQMPRMWDVIQAMDESRFCVNEVG